MYTTHCAVFTAHCSLYTVHCVPVVTDLLMSEALADEVVRPQKVKRTYFR